MLVISVVISLPCRERLSQKLYACSCLLPQKENKVFAEGEDEFMLVLPISASKQLHHHNKPEILILSEICLLFPYTKMSTKSITLSETHRTAHWTPLQRYFFLNRARSFSCRGGTLTAAGGSHHCLRRHIEWAGLGKWVVVFTIQYSLQLQRDHFSASSNRCYFLLLIEMTEWQSIFVNIMNDEKSGRLTILWKIQSLRLNNSEARI